jgi:hypothetical protein
MEELTKELQNLRFNKSKGRRQSIGRTASERTEKPRYYFVSGLVRNYKGVWCEEQQKNIKQIQTSRATYYPKNQRVIQLAKEFMEKYDPEFEYTSIQFNKNICTTKHTDRNNIGLSYILGLGSYENGGELRIYDDGDTHDIDIHEKPYKFDAGNVYHETCDWSGNRFTITYFTIKNYD